MSYKAQIVSGTRVDIILSPNIEDELEIWASKKSITANQVVDSFVHAFLSSTNIKSLKNTYRLAQYKMLTQIGILGISINGIVYLLFMSSDDINLFNKYINEDTIDMGWAILYKTETGIMLL